MMTAVPPGRTVFLTDVDAVGGHDQRLLAWARGTGRIRPHGGVQNIDMLHDDACARMARSGPCDCAPHLHLGQAVVRWEDTPLAQER
jgi:hypothetical protein